MLWLVASLCMAAGMLAVSGLPHAFNLIDGGAYRWGVVIATAASCARCSMMTRHAGC